MTFPHSLSLVRPAGVTLAPFILVCLIAVIVSQLWPFPAGVWGLVLLIGLQSSLISYLFFQRSSANEPLSAPSSAVSAVQRRKQEDQQQIEQEYSYLRALFHSDLQGLIITNLEDEIVLLNETARQQLQINNTYKTWEGSPSTALIAHISQINPTAGQLWQQTLASLKHSTNTSEPIEIQLNKQHLHLLIMPITSRGQLLGRFYYIQDITLNKKREQLRDDLIATMVHDLRSPLQMIHGGLKLLDDILQEDYHIQMKEQDILDISLVNTVRLLSMVNAILDVKQMESHKMPIHARPFVLNEIIEELFDLLRPLARQKYITLSHNLPKHLPPLWGDPGLIQRVLQNLIMNALKFTPEKGAVMVLVEEKDHRFKVLVQDSGPGMAPEAKAQIFRKFAVGDHAHKGSGLGLAFCKMAIEAHNEHIWLEESSAAGTTFAFTLKAAVAEPAPTP